MKILSKEKSKLVRRHTSQLMKNALKRACIYPKDVQRITGKSYRQSLRMLQQIKRDLNKDKDQLVTIEEFSSYTRINRVEVELLII